MKKLSFILAMLAVIFSFFSCKEECEKEKTAEMTVMNNTSDALYFDVTDGNGTTNENRLVQPQASTTYTVPSGTIKVWASFTNITENFILLETRDIEQCAEESYSTITEACSMFSVTDVKVINNTGYGLNFDVTVTGLEPSLGSQFIANGESFTYKNVPATSAIFWYQYQEIWYSTTQSYPLTVCQPFTFTWTQSKMAEVVPGEIMHNNNVEEK